MFASCSSSPRTLPGLAPTRNCARIAQKLLLQINAEGYRAERLRETPIRSKSCVDAKFTGLRWRLAIVAAVVTFGSNAVPAPEPESTPEAAVAPPDRATLPRCDDLRLTAASDVGGISEACRRVRGSTGGAGSVRRHRRRARLPMALVGAGEPARNATDAGEGRRLSRNSEVSHWQARPTAVTSGPFGGSARSVLRGEQEGAMRKTEEALMAQCRSRRGWRRRACSGWRWVDRDVSSWLMTWWFMTSSIAASSPKST